MNRIYATLAVLLLFFGSVLESASAEGVDSARRDEPLSSKIYPEVQQSIQALEPGEMVSVIVTLNDQPSYDQPAWLNPAEQQTRLVRELRQLSTASQGKLARLLQQRQVGGSVATITQLWIFNGMSVTATREVVQELAEHPDVKNIRLNRMIPAPVAAASLNAANDAAPLFNLSMLHVPSLWELGYRGQGVVVANLDTGVSLEHPALRDQWRGGKNSWYDPYNEHPDKPVDLNGHGTWTMGVMVGKETDGMVVGLAPEAQWIAAKIFNDQNQAYVDSIHLAYQWILDPDGNPETADAPDIVNNSWSFQLPGCFLEFQPDLQALRAANILPIFAAGNMGPGETTSVSPANYPEAFAVGAIDGASNISLSSSRGSSSCGEALSTYPEIVAPGVNIRSTGLNGGYAQATGTSLAAPHAAGALALLLSAHPSLSVQEQQDILIQVAYDLGDRGPDNIYGFGRMDVLDAYLALGENQSLPDTGTQVSIPIYLPLTPNSR